jgi:hypothetical protein
MIDFSWLILVTGGLISGVIAGLLGIGGGIITIPLLVTLGYTPVQAIATSSLAIVITSISGSLQNWRMGYFDFKRVIYLGIPAFLTTGIGVYFANKIPSYIILFTFGIILLANIYLIELRKQLVFKEKENTAPVFNPLISKIGMWRSFRRSNQYSHIAKITRLYCEFSTSYLLRNTINLYFLGSLDKLSSDTLKIFG